ncbi:MAG: hypothetical protein VX733_00245 [Candidatus Latescibacterota bacterium]|nr:hypothetical protein [Candidatus Latescibacterota bacterium]
MSEGSRGGSPIARLLLLLSPLLSADSLAWGEQLRLSGYVKEFATIVDPTPLGQESVPTRANSLSRARLRLFGGEGAWSWELAVENILEASSHEDDNSPLNRIETLSTTSYRLLDESDHYIVSGLGTSQLRATLDRALLSYSADMGDLYIGRQPIAFGSARALNPTDVFVPFSYATIDKEERAGVDAVRARFPLGTLSEIDLGWVFGNGSAVRHSAGFLRTRLHLARTDVTPTLIFFRRHWLVGVDVARAVFGAGIWLEAAWVAPHRGQEYGRVSAGADYNLSATLFAWAEYHYSGAGQTRVGDYLRRFHPSAFTTGSVYLLGRHYLSPALIWQATPLTSATAQVLQNLEDRSWLAGARLEHSLGDDLYVEGGAFVGVGEDIDILRGMPRARSEFGIYPDTGFAAMRWYF